jgi:hypothetical protein
MSENVQFDMDNEGSYKSSSYRPSASNPRAVLGTAPSSNSASGMTRWLLNHGVKSESGATLILLGVIATTLVLTGFVYYYFIRTPSVSVNPSGTSPLKEKLGSSHKNNS